MLTRDGRVKILDFGLARHHRFLGAESTTFEVSNPAAITGTPGYMSPEQVRGERTDERSDIFSLGLVLYEMASGKPAFRGASSVEVMNAVLKDDPPELPPASPPMLNRVVRRCLEKDPARRFQSAADLGFAIESTDAVQHAAAPGRLNGRRRRGWLAVAAACVALISGLDYWWRSRSGPSSWVAPEGTVRRLTNNGGLSTQGVISPDGKFFAYASDRAGVNNDSNNLDIWVQQVDGNGAVRITDDPADDYDPAFSPDGTQVAFRSDRQGGGMYIAPAIGGPARLLVPLGRMPRFSPDGHAILYFTGPSVANDIGGMRTSRLFVQPLPEGATTQIGTQCALFPGSAVWSPESKRILFAGTCGNGGTSAWVSGLDGAAPKSNPSLYDLWRTPFKNPIIDQWIANPSRLLLPLERNGTTYIATVQLTDDGARVTGPASKVTFGVGNEVHASAALNGSILLSAQTHESHVWSLAIDGNAAGIGQPRQITRGPIEEMGSTLSRNGRFLAFGDASRRTHIKDLYTGVEREISAGYWAAAPVFSPDGTQIIFANYPNPEKIWENFFAQVPVSGGFPNKIWSVGPGGYSGWPLGWSPDGGTLIFEQTLPDRWRWGFFQLDLQSFKKTAFLEAPHLRLLSANLSNSGQWIAFDGDNGESSSVFAAPVRKGPVPRSEWIDIAFGAQELQPHFSRDDKLILFTSKRDGFRCIWAQRLGSDMRHASAPFGVYHLHQPRRSIGYFAVGPSMIAFDLRERTGDIWILEPVKSRIK
jgi:Tol biopolymer transport system component